MNESDLRSDVHYLGSSEFPYRPYFHYCLSSAHHCEDHFHSWSKHDANLGLQIWPKFAMKAMMMQIQIFIPVVFARKCEVNMISTLPLLCFWYLRKSTNLTYIYTDLLYLQSIKFAYSTKCRQIWCKSICLHHCFTNVVEASNKTICTCFSHVLLQEQICSYTLNL